MLNENLTHRSTETGHFCPKLSTFLQNRGNFFLFLKEGRGDFPSIPKLVVAYIIISRVNSVKHNSANALQMTFKNLVNIETLRSSPFKEFDSDFSYSCIVFSQDKNSVSYAKEVLWNSVSILKSQYSL